MILCPDTIYSDITITSHDLITVDCATQVLCYNPAKEIGSSVAEWLRAWDILTKFEATVCGRL